MLVLGDHWSQEAASLISSLGVLVPRKCQTPVQVRCLQSSQRRSSRRGSTLLRLTQEVADASRWLQSLCPPHASLGLRRRDAVGRAETLGRITQYGEIPQARRRKSTFTKDSRMITSCGDQSFIWGRVEIENGVAWTMKPMER